MEKLENIFDKCIYTIVHSDKLNKIYYEINYSNLSEKKNWANGLKYFKEAKSKNQEMIILFSGAEDTKYLHSWAKIETISIADDKKSTLYTIYELKLFSKKRKKSKIEKIDGDCIPESFIRPYVLCNTPYEWLSDEYEINKDNEIDIYFKNESNSIDSILEELNEKMKKISPEKIEMIIEKTIRNDTKIIKKIKERNNYKCQFPGCTSIIRTKSGRPYIEVAHIKPVKDGGQSILGNLILLCPNHHKEFDLGDLQIKYQDNRMISGKLNEKEFTINCFSSDEIGILG
jgi:hypothetical protein